MALTEGPLSFVLVSSRQLESVGVRVRGCGFISAPAPTRSKTEHGEDGQQPPGGPPVTYRYTVPVSNVAQGSEAAAGHWRAEAMPA